MALDLSLVRASTQAANDLVETLLVDLNAVLWRHEESDSDGYDLRDYVLGAAEAVELNLQSASVHWKTYREVRYAQDRAFLMNISNLGRPNNEHAEPREAERAAQMRAAQQGIFVTLGAAMDCLAAVLVAIAGIGTDVQRADFQMLLPKAGATGFPSNGASQALKKGLAPEGTRLRELQTRLLQGLHAAVAASGPDGWMTWLLAMRNTSVHRERRMEITSFPHSPRKGFKVQRLMPANPHMSNMQAMRTSQDELANLYLHEDALDTFEGIIRGVDSTVVGTDAVALQGWQERRMALDIVVPRSGQWADPRVMTFKGFAPGTAELVNTPGSAMHINPRDAARMKAGRLFDDQRES